MQEYNGQVDPIISKEAIMDAQLKISVSKLPPTDTIISKGTLVDWSNDGEVSEFRLWKTCIVYENLSSGIALKIKKGHLFNSGDTIFVDDGSKIITALDQTNADYDILTLDASSSASTDDFLHYRENAENSDSSKFAFIGSDIIIQEDQINLTASMFSGWINGIRLCENLDVAMQTLINDFQTVKIVPSTATGYPSKSYKSYIALISQTGTNAPTANVLENELGGSITFSYLSPGIYQADSNSLFTAGKTTTSISGCNKSDAILNFFSYDKDVCPLFSYHLFTSANANDIIQRTTIEIRVYD